VNHSFSRAAEFLGTGFALVIEDATNERNFVPTESAGMATSFSPADGRRNRFSRYSGKQRS
jgi:hypothetical protein